MKQTTNQNDIDLDLQYEDLWDLAPTEFLCPKCDELLRVYPMGTSPDDFNNTLICPSCRYCEGT